MKRYYSLTREGAVADIDIYGDIVPYAHDASDVTAYALSRRLAELEDVDTINVNINSYGGSVSEGLAIYNALKRHDAKVVTRCDGVACSIASVIFMAGDERVMNAASLLMIHNAWGYVSGDASKLRKQANDLETVTQASKSAYMSRVSVSEEELSEMMDAETWILPQDAVEMGFATSIAEETAANVNQSAHMRILELALPRNAHAARAAEPVAASAPAKGDGVDAGALLISRFLELAV